jgi:hypothetical protein
MKDLIRVSWVYVLVLTVVLGLFGTGCGTSEVSERAKPALVEAVEPVAGPLPMVRAEGASLVDGQGRSVHLRSENIGGWLAWEQWMQRFQPELFTNQLGRLVGEGDRYNRVYLSVQKAGKRSGVEMAKAANRSVATAFTNGGYVCFERVEFDGSLRAFIFKYINRNEAGGRYVLRLDDPVEGTELASFDAPFTGENEWYMAEIRGTFVPPEGAHDLYVVAELEPGQHAGSMMELVLMELDNKASADELYDLLVDRVDHSLTLYAVEAGKQKNVSRAYDCDPDGVGGYGPGDYIQFNDVTVPAGLTNLSIIAALQCDDPAYDGRYRVEFIDESGRGTLFGEVPMHDTGGWSAYDEITIYTGAYLAAGTYDIRVKGVNPQGGDVGNLHSLRFFAADNADRMVNLFRDVYLTTNDLDALHDLGINAVRVPFNYDLIMNDAGELLPKAQWTNRLDWIVNECAKRGMYTLLDLHAVPGGQNDYEQCMRKEGIRNRVWYVTEHQDRMERIWTAVASHYRGNPAVLGYDIMNEPAPWWEGSGEDQQLRAGYRKHVLPLNRRMLEAIRQVDPEHLVFMEDNAHMTWNSRFLDMLPVPAQEGWSNVVFEIHSYERVLNNRYEGDEGWRNSDILTQKAVADENVRNIRAFGHTHDAPVFIGEFQPGPAEAYDYALRRYNARGVHWCHWNFKVWGSKYGWDSWGLQNRINAASAPHPNLLLDSPEELEQHFAEYLYTNYTANPYLTYVIRRRNENDGPESCGLYNLTFDVPGEHTLSQSWCGELVTTFGPEDAFLLTNRSLRLLPQRGDLTMRLKARRETEAHFAVGDGEQVRLSVEVGAIEMPQEAEGGVAEIWLSLVRDLVVGLVKESDTPAVSACLRYHANDRTVQLALYAANDGALTNEPLYESDRIAFVENGCLELVVNEDTAGVSFAGSEPMMVEHGVRFADWPEEGLAVVDVLDVSGETAYVELENLRAQSGQASSAKEYRLDFAGLPDGIKLRAVPEQSWVQRTWSQSRGTTTYVTNGSLMLIPYDGNWGGTWLQPFSDYQNPLRFALDSEGSLNFGLVFGSFEAGIAKICLMPVCFPAGIYGDYEGPALYVEMNRIGDDLMLTAYRHDAAGGDRTELGEEPAREIYQDGMSVNIGLDAQHLRVYCGGRLMIEGEHGIPDMGVVYPDGVYPHVEFQNDGESTDAVLTIMSLMGTVRQAGSAGQTL